MESGGLAQGGQSNDLPCCSRADHEFPHSRQSIPVGFLYFCTTSNPGHSIFKLPHANEFMKLAMEEDNIVWRKIPRRSCKISESSGVC